MQACIEAGAREGRRFKLLALLGVALAAICMAVLCALPARAWAAADTSWYVGHESDATYTVSDANDLQGLAQLVNAGNSFAGKTVQLQSAAGLAQTVKLSGTWTPIGTAAHPFEGTFAGCGSSIVGLSITAGTDGVGLFGYAGKSSIITNVSVTGSITLSQPASSSAVVKNVGGIVGNSAGSVSNCTSSVKINIDSDVVATDDKKQVVLYVGGIGGTISGNVSSCSTTSSAEVVIDCSTASADTDTTWVCGYVGGIVGCHGPVITDFDALLNPSSVTGCNNAAHVRISVYAAGEPDRFGNPTNANSMFLGGIAGYSTGNFSDCINSGYVDSAQLDADGNPLCAYGTRLAGGIVGGWRTDDMINVATDTDDPGYRLSKDRKVEPTITISNCANTGDVFALGQCGGIVGQAGTYTVITACYNTGNVEGSRYTKPSPAGIAGRSYGNINYCYNTGDITTTSGGGYYAAGIVGMLHSMGTDYNGNTITPEVYACYNSGYIITSGSSYRSGSIVGELDEGYIHDCFSLSDRADTGSVSGLKNYTGTITDTVVELSEAQAKGSAALAALNACEDSDGWKVYFAKGATYPQLVTTSLSGAIDLSKLSGASVKVTANAIYSATYDPAPTVEVTLANGTKLVQNADFRVVGQANTAGVSAGSTKYIATIVGIGSYTGTLSQTVEYAIGKADISNCTVSADSKYFNFEKQKPDAVHVYDAAGNEVDSSQYTWDVDATKWASTSGGYYVYAQDQNATTGYPIIITATSSGNYTGTSTSDVFKIKPCSFASSSDTSDNPNQSTLEFGDIVWGSQTWKFDEVSDTSTHNATGTVSKRGVMKIKYTGSAIKPTITGIKYCGQSLVEIKSGDKWYNTPKLFDYKILYGNPNPELGSDTQTSSYDASVTNVTGTDYACMTIRSAPYSNFDNYINIWYEITPASLSDDCTLTGFADSVAFDGVSAKQTGVAFTYNGMMLAEGVDYIADYQRVDETHMQVTYTGIGNYDGTVVRQYETTGSPTVFADVDYSAWYVTDGWYDFVTLNGIIKGTDQGDFLPENDVTRAQLALMLYRLAGQPSYTQSRTFDDLYTSHFAYDAIMWVNEKGIATGYGGTNSFGPDSPVTREQASKMISVFCSLYGVDISADESILNTRYDGSSVQAFARSYMSWCMSKGIINGIGDTGYLRPQGNTTRAQMAKILCVVVRSVLTNNSVSVQTLSYISTPEVAAEPADNSEGVQGDANLVEQETQPEEAIINEDATE